MLDIAFIRENTELVKEAAKNKNVDVDIDKLIELDKKVSELQPTVEDIRQQRNELASSTKGQKPSDEDIKKGKELREQLEKVEVNYAKAKAERDALWYKIPNIYSNDTPIGKDESANKVVRQEGKKPEFDFEPKEHFEIESIKSLIDLERGAKVAGTRSSFLKGNLVKLQFALIYFAFSVLTDENQLVEIAKNANLNVSPKPFVPVLTPVILRKQVFASTGRLDAEVIYNLEDDDLVLAGSAEHALGPMHMNELLDAKDFPLRYVGYSTNFRREAGSYGKDVKGILRQHQFDKLEMESFTDIEASEDEQEFFVAIQEYLMNSLGLAYQVVAISSGDMGKPDYRQFDIETWMPGQNKYRETQTSDLVTDFQARRMNIRYKSQDGNKFVHMNDATAFAMGRTMIAILENYQTKEGKVKIPEVLKPYMNNEEYL